MPNNLLLSYRQWLSQGRVDLAVIETMQIYHPDFTSLGLTANSLYLANWETSITRDIDDPYPGGSVGTAITFDPARFIYEPTTLGDTTEQSTTLTISAAEGLVYEALMEMTPRQRSTPVVAIPRLYYDDSYTGSVNQLVDPAPIWNLHSVTVSLTSLRGELRADPLRTQRVGRYYTALEFAVLELGR